MSARLPIDDALPAIVDAVAQRGALVLTAEPGAGKTTRVPRALLDAVDGEVLVLEPRRLAARLAARRVAAELGERVGERVGYDVRFESVGGPRTRLRFVTEGILLRRLASDPRLDGVGAVVLDEFHERHLAADVALALVERLRRGARPSLRVVVMSATLDAEPVARFLDAATLHAPGRTFEVAIEHVEPPPRRAVAETPLAGRVASALGRLVDGGGDVLVFLPGAAEIRRAQAACGEVAARAGWALATLHGDLPVEEQERALAPAGRPKVILSTNVAETSLTVPGVVAVIDSGLARVARHSPWSGLPSLETARISQASAAQRAGRAGRTRPGRCVRLYTRHELASAAPHDPPEVRRADLAETALLLHGLGQRDLGAFPWLEAPPVAAVDAAERLLMRLGAVDAAGAVTERGRRMAALPLHPRLARLALEAAARGAPGRGALAAALLGERDLRSRSSLAGSRSSLVTSRDSPAAPATSRSSPAASRDRPAPTVAPRGEQTPAAGPAYESDVIDRVELFEAAATPRLDADRARSLGLDVGAAFAVARAADQIRRAIAHGSGPRTGDAQPVSERPSAADAHGFRPRSRDTERVSERSPAGDRDLPLLLATLAAFPDRLARRRAPHSAELLLAGGGSARLDDASAVHAADLVVAVDADVRPGGAVLVRAASAVAPEWFIDLDADRLLDSRELRFDDATGRVEEVSRLAYDGLVLDETRRDAPPGPDVARRLADAALAAGPAAFTDEAALARLRARVAFAARHEPSVAPITDEDLHAAVLALCEGHTRLADLADSPGALLDALRARLPPPARAAVDRLAPERVALPGGRRPVVEYPPGEQPPFIASRLQDFFGLAAGPAVAGGRVPLVLHLLAPNQRAVQVTTDLAGFWERHYPALRRELMRRYPRHAWPEDPRTAAPPDATRPSGPRRQNR